MAGWKKKVRYPSESPWFPEHYISRIVIGNCHHETSTKYSQSIAYCSTGDTSLHDFYVMTLVGTLYKMLPVIFSECNWTLWYFCVMLIVKLFLILNDICAQITSYKIDNSSFCQECKVRFRFWQLNQQTFVYSFKSVTWFDIPNWPIIHDQS